MLISCGDWLGGILPVFVVDRPWAGRRLTSAIFFCLFAAAGVDEGLLPFCTPIIILYGDSLLEEEIVVTNDSAPSYPQAGAVGAAAASVGPSSHRRWRHLDAPSYILHGESLMKYSRGRLDGSTADEWLYGRRLGASALALSVASYLVMRIVMMAAIEVAMG